MKKLGILAIFLLVILGLGYVFRDPVSAEVNRYIYQSPCATPREYSIGRIDREFSVSEADFRQAVSEAAQMWNTAYGKDIFVYNPDAKLTVSLIYDTRQSLNTEIGHLNDELKAEDSTLKPQLEEYNRKSADLKMRIDALNAEIASWNEKGGAPKDEYERLKKQQEALNAEARDLNTEADRLSITTSGLNMKIDQLNSTVHSFNDALHVKPEGGKYTLDEQGERIEINIFDNRQELVTILAHEIGHALGMNHVSNPDAIMYAQSNNSTTLATEDLAQLSHACRKVNVVQEKIEQVKMTFQQLAAQYSPGSK